MKSGRTGADDSGREHPPSDRIQRPGLSFFLVRRLVSTVHSNIRAAARLYPGPVYDNWFARVDERPTWWDFLFSSAVRLYFLYLAHIGRSGVENPAKTFAYEKRRMKNLYQAFRVTAREAPGALVDQQETPIRLLYVAHPKDFGVLPHSLESSRRHTQNPITEVVVVSPSPRGAERALRGSGGGVSLTFLDERDAVSDSARRMLRQTFGTRYGWALQQFLKIYGVLDRPDLSTLVVDSDTLFFRDKTWIDGSKQLLYFRGFNNPKYYEFLSAWNAFRADGAKSFVTHFQLMQPDVMALSLEYFFSTLDRDEIVAAVCESALRLHSTDFCVDYEPYGQFLSRFFPERFLFDKYSNIGLSRSALDFDSLAKHPGDFPFASANVHDYLDNV